MDVPHLGFVNMYTCILNLVAQQTMSWVAADFNVYGRITFLFASPSGSMYHDCQVNSEEPGCRDCAPIKVIDWLPRLKNRERDQAAEDACQSK